MPASPSPVPARTPETTLTAIGQVSIVAHDIPRATAFYRDALGLPLLFEYPGLAFFNCGGVRLMLSGAETPEFDHRSSVLYFTVGDIGAAHARLVAAGVPFDDEPHIVHRAGTTNLWMTFFRDPDQNVHALMQNRPAEA